jgi:ATP-dependent DNA ligase
VSWLFFIGGMMSVFLMGCYNPATKKWCTVTKVHTGHDDKTLERLQVRECTVGILTPHIENPLLPNQT